MAASGPGNLLGIVVGLLCCGVVLVALIALVVWLVPRSRGGRTAPSAPAPPPTVSPSPPESRGAVFRNHGFPDYPAATYLGSQSIASTGGGGIAWDGLVTTDAPTEVIAYFRGLLGDAGFEADPDGGGLWRRPAEGESTTSSTSGRSCLPVRSPSCSGRSHQKPGPRSSSRRAAPDAASSCAQEAALVGFARPSSP